MKKETKKKISIIAPIIIVLAIAQIMLIACLFNLMLNNFMWNGKLFYKVFSEASYWVANVIVWVVVGVWIFYIKFNDKRKAVVKDNQGGDAHFLTRKEMKKSKDFTVTKFSELSNEMDGIVLQAEKNENDDINVVMSTKPTHTIIIGATGNGKTTGFFIPSIQVTAHTKSQPSLIISDVKGELYDINSARLKELGYKIEVIDLKKPYESTKWNPFGVLIKKIDEIVEINYLEKNEFNEYKWRGKNYEKEQLQVKAQELNDEVFENCKDIVNAICPLSRSNEPKWEEGARDLINAIVLAFCEDYQDGLISAEQFCLASLYHTVVEYATGECLELKDYLLCNRRANSKVKGLANTVLNGEKTTLSSYLTNINDYVAWLSDTSLLSLTSKNEMDFKSFDEQPTALFIKVPDEKDTRHKLVSLLVTQIYKGLVEKANENKYSNKTEDFHLLRRVYFYLDEFGNMPKFTNLPNIITVGKSRRIIFLMVLQSFAQLEEKYGRDVAMIVRSNCNVQIYLGTTDDQTNNTISTLCGKKKVATVSISQANEKQDSFNTQTACKEVALVSADELTKLNNSDDFGNAIITILGHYPMRTKYTPSFEMDKIYGLKREQTQVNKKIEVFIEADHIFDIKMKNEMQEQLQKDNEKMADEAEANDKDLMNEQEYKQKQKDKIDEMLEQIQKKIKSCASIFGKEQLDKLLTASIGEKLEQITKLIESADIKDKAVLFKMYDIKTFIEYCKKVIVERGAEQWQWQ